MINPTKSWYALYTKPGCERKVANLLSRKNVEFYLPLLHEINGRRKLLQKPLFNSYIFIRIRNIEIENFRAMEHVVNFIYWLGKEAVIHDEEIEVIKRFLSASVQIRLEKIYMGVNRIEKFSEGDTSESKKKAVSYSNATLKIMLPSLGYMLIAEIGEKTNIEVTTGLKQLISAAPTVAIVNIE